MCGLSYVSELLLMSNDRTPTMGIGVESILRTGARRTLQLCDRFISVRVPAAHCAIYDIRFVENLIRFPASLDTVD